MRLADFDYDLPAAAIAQQPIEPRDHSRLLVLPRDGGPTEHRRFDDLPGLLRAGDLLVLNDTRVMPARLHGRRVGTGARIEVLLLQRLNGDRWETLVRPGRRARPGDQITFGDGQLRARIGAVTPFGGRVVEFSYSGEFTKVLAELGRMPLPPYIQAELPDGERYQTVYAAVWGSAAAPTAGLHFTPRLLERLQDGGVELAFITLHVGLGTFRPVEAADIRDHTMHAEFYQVSQATAAAVDRARERGGRVVAVGTTTVRTLESLAGQERRLQPGSGWTDLFIYPGYAFRVIDGMVTNFHLPRSSLLMLVSALAGRERVLAAYAEAVAAGYRFYSFGDAMLII